MSTSRLSVDDFRRRAQRRLPRIVFDYLEGGVDDEHCLGRNVSAPEQFEFVPKRLRDVGVRDISTELFGQKLAAPFIVGPTAFNGLLWRDGDLVLARAAASAGVPFVLSTAAQESMERVAEAAPGNLWFQLYVVERAHADKLIRRASAAGYRTLVVTVDVLVNANRERDVRNGFSLPLQISPRLLAQGLRHPRWLLHFLRHGRQGAAHVDGMDSPLAVPLARREMDATLTWDYLRYLRDSWPYRLVVKGILDDDDAVRCGQCGADAILISNHGGRQLDTVPAPITLLQRVTALTDRPLIVDGGFRRGAHIVKALALGASAVSLGRAVLYALAAGGPTAVNDVIAYLADDVDRTLAQIGCASVRELRPSYIRPRSGSS